jgi:flagellar motor switch protein FliN/FliY
MADEEVKEDQENTEAETAETENPDNPEDDMDSLMNEMAGNNSTSTDFGSSGDLSSLITETVESTDENFDEMLESATESSSTVDEMPDDEDGVDLKFLLKMPLTMTFEVGRAKMNINDLLSLGQGSVLELHRLVGENLDMFVSGKLIAQGEVVVSNEKFGARITQIIPPEERVKKMGGMDKSN